MHPRELAARNGENTYHGLPCKTCGNTKRYTINSTCVNCVSERAKIRVKQRREAIKAMLDQAKAGA